MPPNRMSANPARPLRLPPANFSRIKIPRVRQPTRNWFRLHQTKFSAVYFSLAATHRFSHAACQYPFLYLGVDVDTCLFERFGDLAYDNQRAIPKTVWDANSLSIIRVPEVHVCDLTNSKTLSSLMVDLSALMHTDMAAPQAWGRAIQEHPANFRGIKFKSRFNGKACLALFKRDGMENHLRESLIDTLPKTRAAADWLDKHKVSLF